nr:hypothetical protein [Tanacetum cinerariifolium]
MIQIFYHRLDEPTQAILDDGRILLYKTPNEAHQLLNDRALLKLDWSQDMKAQPIRKTVTFAKTSNDSKLMEKMEALITKIDSQFKEIKGEIKEMLPRRKISRELLYVINEVTEEELDALLDDSKPFSTTILLPVFISSLLKDDEKNLLVCVLKKHKETFAWKTSDIPSIIPSFCKHKINFEDDAKPVIQRQHSPWVSSVQCVPKKGGMIVETNEENELVPTRTVIGWHVCINYDKIFLQLHELDELRLQACENFKLYKARTKANHDRKLRIQKKFKVEDRVLLYNSKYKFKDPKLRSKWYGPFVVRHGFSSGYLELYDQHGGSFIINGHRVKLYHDEEQINELTTDEIHLMCDQGKTKAIPFMAPFLVDYRETMPWVAENPFVYSVVEDTCNEAKLYDLDETDEGIVKGNFHYVKKDLKNGSKEKNHKGITSHNNHHHHTCHQCQLKSLIDQGIADAMAARDADRSRNGEDIHNSGTGVRRQAPLARECTYLDFIKFKTIYFKGTKGVVKLTQWYERMKITVGHDIAYAMTWKNLKKKMTDKYCLRGEIKKLEVEMWNLKVKESDKIERHVGGLPDMIHGSVIASKPKTIQVAVEFATELMDKKF